jgi:hypothetical protein
VFEGGKAPFIANRELIHRGSPVLRGAFPLGRDVSQRQPDQFRRGVVIRKMSTRLDDFSELGVDASSALVV